MAAQRRPCHGGEEFLIVLPGAALEQANEIADRVHESVQGSNIEHASSSAAAVVTVSIGLLVQTVATAESASTALERCDDLLYEAKGTGRNRTVAARQ